jgi:hypothetical protein
VDTIPENSCIPFRKELAERGISYSKKHLRDFSYRRNGRARGNGRACKMKREIML